MACCPSHGAATQGSFTRVPPVEAEATQAHAWSSSFTETNINNPLPDGYWIEAFPFRTKPDAEEGPVGPEIIGYGLGALKDGSTTEIIPSEVKMYLNPLHNLSKQVALPDRWESTTIQTLDFPVALTYGNFRPKSGLNDVIICHDYGPSMDNLNEEGGTVSYLKNPGDRTTGNWERRRIGRHTAMHRLKTGYFTQKEHLEVMALPIMIASGDRESPAPVIIYKPKKWDDDGTPSDEEWEAITPINDTFRLIHDVQIIHSTTGGLDKALVAGREGVSLTWMDEKTGQWRYENIGTGIPQSRKPFENPYWGSGSAATARVGNDSVGYIASCEAFHGNLVSVYVKPPGTRQDQIVTNEHWRRFVIDDFGPLKDGEFTGTIHQVLCADLDGSGVDSIVVACMGWPENKPENMGTYVYRPLDLQRGLFARSKISNASAGRLAIADYRCSGTLDVASISYSVPNYLVTPNPALRVMLNNRQTRHAIKAQRLGDELMIRVPRAASAQHTSEMPFLDVGGKLLSIVVVPPHREYLLGAGFKYQGKDYQKDGVKVINGELCWTPPGGGTTVKRGIAVDRHRAASMIPNATENIVKAGPNGAIFIRMASSIATEQPGLKFEHMEDVASINAVPSNVDHAVRDLTFTWVACRDREWGQGGFNWPFYNLVGYHVLYDDDTLTNVCHIQAWTLGVGETAAFHIHDTKPFGEIHACISNGTHKGGMWWARDAAGNDFLSRNREERDQEILKQHADNVIVDDMQEHGPLWHVLSNGRPKLLENGAVDYPYHGWLAGPGEVPKDPQAFDVWLAFEFPPIEFHTNVSKFNGCAAC